MTSGEGRSDLSGGEGRSDLSGGEGRSDLSGGEGRSDLSGGDGRLDEPGTGGTRTAGGKRRRPAATGAKPRKKPATPKTGGEIKPSQSIEPAIRVVAVTGATGFLGAHIVAALAGSGVKIRVLVHRQPAHPLWRDLPVETITGSVMDPVACAALTAGADVVIHAAGLIKTVREAEYSEVNVEGTAILTAAARAAGIGRFVLVSSLAAREPMLSRYAGSKRAGEFIAQSAYLDRPQSLVILRPPAIYGPWDPETLAFFKGLSGRFAPVFGSGRSVIVHVEDAAEAIAQVAMGAGEAGCFALTGPDREAFTLREMLQTAAAAAGRNPRLVKIPAPLLRAAGAFSGWQARRRQVAQIFTVGKARELLHPDWTVSPGEALPYSVFKPAISLPEGFRKTVDWYKTNGWLS